MGAKRIGESRAEVAFSRGPRSIRQTNGTRWMDSASQREALPLPALPMIQIQSLVTALEGRTGELADSAARVASLEGVLADREGEAQTALEVVRRELAEAEAAGLELAQEAAALRTKLKERTAVLVACTSQLASATDLLTKCGRGFEEVEKEATAEREAVRRECEDQIEHLQEVVDEREEELAASKVEVYSLKRLLSEEGRAVEPGLETGMKGAGRSETVLEGGEESMEDGRKLDGTFERSNPNSGSHKARKDGDGNGGSGSDSDSDSKSGGDGGDGSSGGAVASPVASSETGTMQPSQQQPSSGSAASVAPDVGFGGGRCESSSNKTAGRSPPATTSTGATAESAAAGAPRRSLPTATTTVGGTGEARSPAAAAAAAGTPVGALPPSPSRVGADAWSTSSPEGV